MNIANGKDRGFTLTEMLVVIGIIALVLGILLPVVTTFRRYARTAACASNMREIGLAFSQYMTDYEGAFPDASISNSGGSPYSPKGLSVLKKHYGYVPYQPITVGDGPLAKDQFDQRWGKGICLPAIGFFFAHRFAPALRVWNCPAAGKVIVGGESQGFSLSTSTLVTEDPDRVAAYCGNRVGDSFVPSYMYMATKEFEARVNTDPTETWLARLPALIVRNISGLSQQTCKPVNRGNAGEIVTFTEMNVGGHSGSDGNARSLMEGGRAKFVANFLYLDGHVAAEKFYDFDSYLALFHGPIKQRQLGRDYAVEYGGEFEK